ncbi:MAG: LysR family transcriptional regulator [Paracoccus sp. (in: a-proteobacteria)]
MLTLRQIEVIRAITVAGTVKGAAELLNVSAPGISRVMKHTESQLGIRLFSRTHGRYTPTEEARDIFAQVTGVFQSVENLQYSIEQLKAGSSRSVGFAAVPSVAHHVFPAAIRQLRTRFPELRLKLNTIKIEEAIDYLLLRKGEMVALSYKLDHPGLTVQPLYSGRIVAILPEDHPLTATVSVSLKDMVQETLIGIDPDDPYGSILAEPFRQHGMTVDYTIEARTSQMIAALVGQKLGVALIDELSLAGPIRHPGITVRPLHEASIFRAFAAFATDKPRSIFTDALVSLLRQEMSKASIS